ncbi:helix-turn-helix domain-containing protein [Taibaiella soli]|uniref:AraC family transcriptional regulator n=1 Tax=Taibaiella soli TaxID=1649169 RepID=A0A2W2AVC8_9BACT|nr:response regulator transcription factor [Taibaiella soli]PZF71904.1 AraC family transcriptional regulator [Taibaiella soli]
MENTPHHINSISALHKLLGLPKPLHPLVSLIRNCDVKTVKETFPANLLLHFYKISFMEDVRGKIKYGQGHYDFEEGGMVFVAPDQVLAAPDDSDAYDGFNLFIHPDFFQTYPLAAKIKKYHFFSYASNEALHLSDKEKKTMLSVFKIIGEELEERIDDFSQDVVISQIELLLNYSNRFYKRQFNTRKTANHDVLSKLENILDSYFESDKAVTDGLPTVQYLSDQLHLSPHYLSDLLRTLTGMNTQQHIHQKLIEKAKTSLSTTNRSIAEIAYNLGFGYPQSFNKFFKSKTNQSPVEFRQSFH